MSDFFAKESQEIWEQIRMSGEEVPWFIALDGPIGAGKTTFVKRFLADRGLDPSWVQSPTFLKILEYKIPHFGTCVHMDAYRIEKSSEIEFLGLENFEDVRLWIVEWPGIVMEYLAANSLLRAVLGFKRYLWIDLDENHKLKCEWKT